MREFDNFELKRRVDEVLFYVWDPIGVSPDPYARAEYESYVPEILKLLEESNGRQPISEYLIKITGMDIGLPADQKRCELTAELLLMHKEAVAGSFA